MKYPAVLLVSWIIGMLCALPTSAAPVSYSTLKTNVESNACGNVGARKGYTEAMRKTWAQIRGADTEAAPPSGAPAARTCGARADDIAECCRAGDNQFKSKCEQRFREISRYHPLPGNSGIPDGADIQHDNPFDSSADASGLRAGMTGTKAALFKSSREKDRMAGMCRAMFQACDNACESDATNRPRCREALTTSDQICLSANTDLLNSGYVNPGLAGPGRNPPGGNSPGGNSPGGGQNGGQTQKPQAAGAGGNPMDALGKALQAMNQQQQQPQQQNPNNDPTQQNCESNPALAGCPVKVDDPWAKKKTGTAEMKDEEGQEAAGGDEFNVADNLTAPSSYTGNGEQKFGTPATNATVANGGGQIPGGQGGAAAQAGGAAGGYAGASKAATDIMHGMMSGGGYSQMNAAMQMQNGANGGGFSGYGAQGGDQFKNGMDLRQFLPGGKADPTRKLAGGAASFQIQPQTVNIWSRISERIKARCSQGLLRDCN